MGPLPLPGYSAVGSLVMKFSTALGVYPHVISCAKYSRVSAVGFLHAARYQCFS